MSRRSLALFAGLAGGPFLWAVCTQLGPVLPYAECSAGFPVLAPIAFAAALISVTFGAWAWSVARAADAQPPGAFPHPRLFLARLGALTGLMFALALFYQALASLLLSGCER